MYINLYRCNLHFLPTAEVDIQCAEFLNKNGLPRHWSEGKNCTLFLYFLRYLCK